MPRPPRMSCATRSRPRSRRSGRFTWQGKSIYPWLRQIAINKVYDVHRQSKRSRRLADAMVHEVADRDRSRHARRRAADRRSGARAHTATRIDEAMGQLAERYRTAIELRLDPGAARARSARSASASRSARSTSCCSAPCARSASTSASATTPTPETSDGDRRRRFLTGPVPAPDAEPTAAERAHAKTFADLVDKTLAGRTPPAMSRRRPRAARGRDGDPRGERQGRAARRRTQRSLVEDALRQAVGGAAPRRAVSVTPIARGRARRAGRRGRSRPRARSWPPPR